MLQSSDQDKPAPVEPTKTKQESYDSTEEKCWTKQAITSFILRADCQNLTYDSSEDRF